MESTQHREPWNKGKLVGQKPPLKPKDIWAIRIHLQNAHQVRSLAMFNLAIDSKLRGCDLVNLRVRDVTHGKQIMARAMVVQRKTQRPVQFELTEPTRSFDSAVRPDRASVGCCSWARLDSLRHAYDEKDEGDADLQTNEEPASRPASPWAFQTGEYHPVPWDRGG